jgi:hypothetical protein
LSPLIELLNLSKNSLLVFSVAIVLRATDRFSGYWTVIMSHHEPCIPSFRWQGIFENFCLSFRIYIPASCSISLRLKPCFIFSKCLTASWNYF